jgi:hypothetical protein
MMNGRNVTTQAHRDLITRMVAAGHLVANHSQHHLDLKKVTEAKLRAEVEATRDVLASAGVTPGFFRFPFGSASCSAAATVREYGYHVTGWHIDSADWCYAAGGGYCAPSTFRYVDDQYRGDIVGYVTSQARRLGGGVILFHDTHAWSVAHLDDVLTALEQEGFTFVRLDDAQTFPKLNGATPPAAPWIGTPCTGDAECAFTAGGASGFCAVSGGAGFCSLPCAGYCPDRPGAPATFCVSLDGESGRCAARAGGDACAAIPGTAPTSADRWAGDSGAPAATATVCLPR